MRIGYACLALGVIHSDYRTTRLDNLTNERLIELIDYNLESLDRMIDYNIENNIKLFRITSDIVPFGSSPRNQLNWQELFKEKFLLIGEKIKNHQIHVSMHPGQYTVLNSPKEDVVTRSIDDLVYHTTVLDLLEVDEASKVVLHIGGVYGDKEEAMKRFVENFQKLPLSVKRRLIIENDDRNYNIEEVLAISKLISIPVVFDNLHHFLNAPSTQLSDADWINLCKLTWKKKDGVQKVHYSEQDPEKQPGAHSFSIDPDTFLSWYRLLTRDDLNVMLEVKDKNISAIKIAHCITPDLDVSQLEKAWVKYRHKVLEHSPLIYLEICNLLKDKSTANALEFYRLIECSFKQELILEHQVKALTNIWEYFKDHEELKSGFMKRLDKVQKGEMPVKTLKNYVYSLAVNNNISALVSSYYFAF